MPAAARAAVVGRVWRYACVWAGGTIFIQFLIILIAGIFGFKGDTGHKAHLVCIFGC